MQALSASQAWKVDPQRVVLWAGAALVTTAAAEFLLLRLFTRTAIHVPGIQELTTAYTLLTETGRLGYFAATILIRLLSIGEPFDLLAAGGPVGHPVGVAAPPPRGRDPGRPLRLSLCSRRAVRHRPIDGRCGSARL